MFKNQFIIQSKDGERYILWGTVESWKDSNPELFDDKTVVPVSDYTADEIVSIFRNIVSDDGKPEFSNTAKMVLNSIRKINKLSPQEEKDVILEFVQDFCEAHYIPLMED